MEWSSCVIIALFPARILSLFFFILSIFAPPYYCKDVLHMCFILYTSFSVLVLLYCVATRTKATAVRDICLLWMQWGSCVALRQTPRRTLATFSSAAAACLTVAVVVRRRGKSPPLCWKLSAIDHCSSSSKVSTHVTLTFGPLDPRFCMRFDLSGCY